MKKISFAFIYLLFSLFVTAQNFKDFVKTSKDLYFSTCEVSNADYREFLHYLKKSDQIEKYNRCLPDTMLWGKYNKPLSAYYFSYPAYSDYPVVAIKYDNTMEYCQWLTEIYCSKINRKFKKVVFRLPTGKEWSFAANGGDMNKIYTWGSPFLLNLKKGYMCNYLRIGDNQITYNPSSQTFNIIDSTGKNAFVTDKAIIPVPVKAFYPNQFGLYNMCGNVAEMVMQQGIARGGSFNDPGYDVRIASEKKYTTPSIEIGFRVIMEVLEK